MSTTYAKSQTTAQKKDAPSAASVLDASSQSESLQRKANMANNAAQRAEAPRPNNTGMPDNLKAGIESLSGFSMDNVRVHYNSSKPATVQALAYTQGTDIHVAPGQEKHLPHEAWHVAQQMAGRVSPTTNINGMPVNDNAALEHEADVMGEKAVSQRMKLHADDLEKSHTTMNYLQRMPEKNIDLFKEYNYSGTENVVFQKSGNLENGASIKYNSILKSESGTYSKIDALKSISEKAGELGPKVPDYKFQAGEFFYAEYEAEYETGWVDHPGRSNPPTHHKEILNLKYQFGPEWTGYIKKVTKWRSEGERKERIAEMIECDSDTTGVDKKYSNRHGHRAVVPGVATKKIIDDTYKAKYPNGTKVDETFMDEVPDAYTKLAGEGARFQCVRRNIENLNDDTVFYPIGQTSEIKYGIKFSDLWKTWKMSFNKKYNIPDKDVSDEMMKNGCQIKKSNGEMSDRKEADPENRVKLDGFSTIESEKNFDNELLELSWRFSLDLAIMDVLQNFEPIEKEIVCKMNSRNALVGYYTLSNDNRKKINDLSIERIEKLVLLEEKEKNAFFALDADILNLAKQKLLDFDVAQISQILSLEKSLMKNVLTLGSANIVKIISLTLDQIKEFFGLSDDERKNRLLDLNVEQIGKFLSMDESQKKEIINQASANISEIISLSSDQIKNLWDLADKQRGKLLGLKAAQISRILSLEKTQMEDVLTLESANIGVIISLTNTKRQQFFELDDGQRGMLLKYNLNAGHIKSFMNLENEQKSRICECCKTAELVKKILDCEKTIIDKLLGFDSDKLNRILMFDSEEIGMISDLPTDKVAKLLAYDDDGVKKILKCGTTIIDKILEFDSDKLNRILMFDSEKIGMISNLPIDEVAKLLAYDDDGVKKILKCGATVIDKILGFDSDKLNRILMFDSEEIGVISNLPTDKVAKLLAYDNDKVKKILKIGSRDWITGFLKMNKKNVDLCLTGLTDDGFVQLIGKYSHSFALLEKNLKKYKTAEGALNA